MAEKEWLTQKQQQTWRSFLNVNTLLFECLDRQLQQDASLPHAYYAILVYLSEAPERTLKLRELAHSLNFSVSRLSHAVTRLESNGWVRREACLTDGRSTFAVLTDEGFDVLAAAAPGHVDTVRSNFFDALTAEQVEQLRAICDAVVSQIQSHGECDPEPPSSAGS